MSVFCCIAGVADAGAVYNVS